MQFAHARFKPAPRRMTAALASVLALSAWTFPSAVNGQVPGATSKPSVSAPPQRKLPFNISDMRGKGDITGSTLAGAASKKMFTVLEIHGSDPEIIKTAENILLEMYHSGRTRVGLVIADGKSNEWNIWAGGDLYNYYTKADSSNTNRTSFLIVDQMTKAYDTITAPAWKAAQEAAAKKPTGAAAVEAGPANKR